jgi:hypothetical protein
VSGRGLMRKRGPKGGGTLRRKSPQHGQRPSLPMGAVASARIHCPRASHCALMHCTVKPGRNCMCGLPQRPAELCVQRRSAKSPGWPKAIVGADFESRSLWCQAKRLQDVGAALPVRRHAIRRPWLPSIGRDATRARFPDAQLLAWKGMEATEKLAASANTKVVIIGNPKNGLPLVLEPR